MIHKSVHRCKIKMCILGANQASTASSGIAASTTSIACEYGFQHISSL